MKNYLLITLLAFSTPIIAQDKTKEECKPKTSILRTGFGLSCLAASILTAIQTKKEYSRYNINLDILKYLTSSSDTLQSFSSDTLQSFGILSEKENKQYRIELKKDYVAYGSATIALATIGIVNIVKGLGLSK